MQYPKYLLLAAAAILVIAGCTRQAAPAADESVNGNAETDNGAVMEKKNDDSGAPAANANEDAALQADLEAVGTTDLDTELNDIDQELNQQ
ncbi:MAG: hypothetical protein Q7S23_00170 [bacterium]|nr:hypothetical protein [bacterium]